MNPEEQHVFMSTESKLKHDAVVSAMARVGVKVRVTGKKVDSGVNEQPKSIHETYEGARNRQNALRELGEAADYYITVESGLCQPVEEGGIYGCNAIIIEPVNQQPFVGFAIDTEFPSEVVEQIPSVYADFGVWAQQAHGASEKDPYPYIAGGHLTRRKTIEDAVYNVAVQLKGEQEHGAN